MKNSTIWESASRPLFVRSVWLENTASEGTRTLRRHFILDYEPRERERLRSSCASPARKRRANYRESTSYEDYYDNLAYFNDSYDLETEDCMLLETTKLKLQQSQQQFTRTTTKSSRCTRRRNWLLGSRKSATYCANYMHAGRKQELHDLYSRRSSLQDIQSTQFAGQTSSNLEEKLAERVLNWLDLAGKTDIVKEKPQDTAIKDNMGKEATGTAVRKSLKARITEPAPPPPTRRIFKRVPTAHPSRNSAAATTSSSAQRRNTTDAKRTAAAATTTTLNTTNCQHNRPDSVKPITIIFDKEGVPVRLNRAARNIDLCALSSSASTTRRMAGPLASARLYNGSSGNNSARGLPEDTHRTTPPQTCRSLQDTKKQLHIFMPSLPKKGLLLASSGSYPSTECDAQSALSHTFSELCQI